MRVLLIRHAQSETNAGLPTSAPGAAALTPIGREQARLLAASFLAPPSRVVISAYVRTSQTAAPLLARFPGVPAATMAIHEFTYLAPEKYADTTLAERIPNVNAYWQACDPFTRDGQGAESFEDFAGRVDALLAWLTGQAGEQIDEQGGLAVFSHGQFLKCLALRLLSPHLTDMRELMRRFRSFREGFVIPNAGVLELTITGSGDFRLGGVQTGHLAPGPLTY